MARRSGPPAATPKSSSGTTCPPKSATTPRTGRTNARSPAPQRIVFGNVSPATTRGTTSARTSAAAPARNRLARGDGLAARRIDDDEVGDVHLLRLREALRRPSSACRRRRRRSTAGGPSDLGGAVLLALGKPAQHDARGAAASRTTRPTRRREALLRERLGQAARRAPARAGSSAGAGISSVRISRRKSWVVHVGSDAVERRVGARRRLLKRPPAPAPRAASRCAFLRRPRRPARRRRRDRGSAG